MYQILINEDIELNVPETEAELSLSSAIQFSNAYGLYSEWAKKADKKSSTHELEYIYHIINCVESFLDVEGIDSIEVGDIKDINKASKRTLIGIFKTGLKIINDFIPIVPGALTNYEFVHNERTYQLPKYLVNTLASSEAKSDKMKLSEMIEALEVKKWCEEFKVERSKEKGLTSKQLQVIKNDADYTELITLLAILSREVIDGEIKNEWPKTQTAINDFITRRIEEFTNINYRPGYDLGFFLTSIMSA